MSWSYNNNQLTIILDQPIYLPVAPSSRPNNSVNCLVFHNPQVKSLLFFTIFTCVVLQLVPRAVIINTTTRLATGTPLQASMDCHDDNAQRNSNPWWPPWLAPSAASGLPRPVGRLASPRNAHNPGGRLFSLEWSASLSLLPSCVFCCCLGRDLGCNEPTFVLRSTETITSHRTS